METTSFEGVVSRFDDVRHFGFIRYPAGEIFVHRFDIQDGVALVKGQRVSFELGEYKGRSTAKKVKPIPTPSATIEATVAEIEMLKNLGIDLCNGHKVRAALLVVRQIAKAADRE